MLFSDQNHGQGCNLIAGRAAIQHPEYHSAEIHNGGEMSLKNQEQDSVKKSCPHTEANASVVESQHQSF
jgi:hypothetical protein